MITDEASLFLNNFEFDLNNICDVIILEDSSYIEDNLLSLEPISLDEWQQQSEYEKKVVTKAASFEEKQRLSAAQKQRTRPESAVTSSVSFDDVKVDTEKEDGDCSIDIDANNLMNENLRLLSVSKPVDVPSKLNKTNSQVTNVGSFPTKLLRMLSDTAHAHIVGWMPHGRAFKVFNIPAFEKYVMPRYFNTCKEKSFRRQLCLWGFTRMNKGLDKGGYFSPLFVRGKPELIRKMVCVKVKGVGGKAKDANQMDEPNFYELFSSKSRCQLPTHFTDITVDLHENLRAVSPALSTCSSISSSSIISVAPLTMIKNESYSRKYPYYEYNIDCRPAPSCFPYHQMQQYSGSGYIEAMR